MWSYRINKNAQSDEPCSTISKQIKTCRLEKNIFKTIKTSQQ